MIYVFIHSANYDKYTTHAYAYATECRYDKASTVLNDGAVAVTFDWSELPECPDSSVDHTVFCHAVSGGHCVIISCVQSGCSYLWHRLHV